MFAALHHEYFILKKTIRFQVHVTQPTTNFVEIPITLNGRNARHTWKIEWNSKSPTDFYGSKFVGERLEVNLTATSHPEGLKYAKSHYEVKILYVNRDTLAEYKGDMQPTNYNHFKIKDNPAKFKKPILHTDTLLVSVTLCSYPKEKCKSFEPQKKMLDMDILTDVVIQTKQGNIKCHKFVLATESDYFRAMFEADMKERNDSVVNWIDVFEADTVADMLHYVYTGQKPPKIQETCVELMELSQMCLLEDLKTVCACEIREVLSEDNMVEILKLAAKLQCADLQELVINFMVDNYLVDSDGPAPWEALEPALAKTVLSSVLRTMVVKKLYI